MGDDVGDDVGEEVGAVVEVVGLADGEVEGVVDGEFVEELEGAVGAGAAVGVEAVDGVGGFSTTQSEASTAAPNPTAPLVLQDSFHPFFASSLTMLSGIVTLSCIAQPVWASTRLAARAIAPITTAEGPHATARL